jgi:hypothetical protein
MAAPKTLLVGAFAALALSACAVLEGLNGFGECTSDCDASARPRDGALDAPPAALDAAETGGGSEASDDATGDAAPAGGDDSGEGSAPLADAGDGGATVDSGPTCSGLSDVAGNLLVYYPLEGDTNDHSGNGNNGSATADTDITFGAGKVGQGVSVLTTGRGIGVSGGASLGTSRTLCAWVNTVTGTTGGGLPVFVVGPTGSADLYDISAANPNAGCPNPLKDQLFIDHWGSACVRSSQAAPEAQWDFVCFAQNGTSTIFFMNGASGTSTTSAPYANLLSTITLGADRVAGSTTQVLFKGQLDEISIWSAALSTGDMNAIFSGGAGCHIR